MSKKLSLKVLAILGATMGMGFALLGGLSLYLEYNTILNYERAKAENWAKAAISTIETSMSSGDMDAVNAYMAKTRKSGDVLGIDIYDADGKSGTGKTTSKEMLEALSLGHMVVKDVSVNDTDAVLVAYPMRTDAKCLKCHPNAGKFLGGISLTSSIAQGKETAIHLAASLAVAGLIAFTLMLSSVYWFIKKSVIRRIAVVSEQIRAIAEGEGDLTSSLSIDSDDEIGQLASGVSKLIETLRNIIGSLYKQAGHIAIASCRIATSASDLAESTTSQKELAYSVAVASEEMAATLNEVSGNTNTAAALSLEVQASATDGITSMENTADSVENLRLNIVDTMEIMDVLEESSNKIGNIVDIIDDIAQQTNLLALNASIEAARAGEAGRGFAVVANEVKVLSGKTANSTKEISEIIKNIQMEISNVKTAVYTGQSQAEDGVALAKKTQEKMQHMLGRVMESAEMINQIAVATEEQSQTTVEISSKISHVSEAATMVKGLTEKTMEVFRDVSATSEQMYATVSRFNVGNYHNHMHGLATELQEKIQGRLLDALSRGELTEANLFDRNHKIIPNSNPSKYTTRFDKFFDDNISCFQEETLAKDNRIVFAIAVDTKGYVPCHNRKFSQRHTGDPEKDRLLDRTKRMFNDRTGLKAAESTNRFLLQTYIRDTGEIMNDISVPIVIHGQHWGAVRIGYTSED